MKVFMNIQLFDNATVRVDAEKLVCITDIYKIAVERGLDGGKLDLANGHVQGGMLNLAAREISIQLRLAVGNLLILLPNL